jgi:hypothetical protein
MMTISQTASCLNRSTCSLTVLCVGEVAQMAVVLADGIKGEFRFCVESVTATRFYNPDDHSLKLPAGGRLRKRDRLSGSRPGAQRVLQAPPRALPEETAFENGSDPPVRR